MADDKPAPPTPPGRRKILGVPVLIFFLVLTPLAVVAFVAVCTTLLLLRG